MNCEVSKTIRVGIIFDMELNWKSKKKRIPLIEKWVFLSNCILSNKFSIDFSRQKHFSSNKFIQFHKPNKSVVAQNFPEFFQIKWIFYLIYDLQSIAILFYFGEVVGYSFIHHKYSTIHILQTNAKVTVLHKSFIIYSNFPAILTNVTVGLFNY